MTEAIQQAQSAPQTTETTQVSAPVSVAPESQPTQESTPEVNSFIEKLDPSFKEVKSFKNLKDVNDLAKMALNAQQLIGKKVQDWAAEDIKAVYRKLGAPEDINGYQLPTEVGEEDAKAFKEMSLKAGLSTDQAKTLIDEIVVRERAQKEMIDKRTQQIKEEWSNEIKKMWGDPATVEKRTYVADRAIKDLGGEGLDRLLTETGLKDHPSVKKVFADIGVKYLYEHEVVGVDKASTFGQTPEDAKRQIDLKLQDNNFRDAYYKAFHPNHKAAVAEMEQLRQKASGGSPVGKW